MNYQLYPGDCLELFSNVADKSVNLAAIDFPYMGVVDAGWDNQWKTRADFLHWIGLCCDQVKRVLTDNGSFYAFASPQMAWYVEGVIRERFNVLNRVTWIKEAGWHQKSSEETLRSYFPQTEAIFLAEQFNSDNIALGESKYVTECDKLRGFIFEPLRAYLDGERERAGVTVRQVAEAFQRKTGSRTVTGMAGHWFTKVQWVLPTEANYEWLRQTLSEMNHNGEYLRRDYEELRRDYEELRRPFNATPDAPYTDVWTFPTVSAYPGKHPTEKPLALMKHIVSLSSRPGDTVLDCCMGFGTTGVAAGLLGRRFIGMELDARNFAEAQSRIAAAYGDWGNARKRVVATASDIRDLPLFALA
jgi:adenine-specific DNA-methyltransferase